MKELIKFQNVNTDRVNLTRLLDLRPIERFRPLSVYFEQALDRNLGSRPIIKELNEFKIVNYFLLTLINIITYILNNYF